MAASIGLVEARVKDAEEALKAQYKRMKDTLEAVANKVVDDIDPIPKDEPKESREGPYGRARDVNKHFIVPPDAHYAGKDTPNTPNADKEDQNTQDTPYAGQTSPRTRYNLT